MADKPVKVHLGVTPAMQEKLQAGGDKAVEDFGKRLGLSQLRADRLSTFGVLSSFSKSPSFSWQVSFPISSPMIRRKMPSRPSSIRLFRSCSESLKSLARDSRDLVIVPL